MPYVQRNEAGAIVGRFARPQEGIPEEFLEDDHAEIVALKEADATRLANAERRAYLASTDWYVTRQVETGVAVPEKVTAARQAAREAIAE